ncbi:GTPase domain-containing protein [Sediminihabitans luteus]|nr:GTPase domain-containing protein [Sediminihabitans luteus]
MTDPERPADDAATGLDTVSGALEVLRARVEAVRLPLDAPGAQAARATRAGVLAQVDDYLLPRLRTAAAPLLVVVGGSTGAGKSTLVNSLLGERVSAPGVLRPTTRSPVLAHHPQDAPWFTGDRVLPGLARVVARTAGGTDGRTGDAAGASSGAPASVPAALPDPAAATAAAQAGGGLTLVATVALPAGIALLDAPDVDSVADENRALAAQLLAAADLWLFVTTAARYADAVPWDVLAGAAGRDAQVALVLDRLDAGTGEVVPDLRALVAAQGLEDAPLFVIPESALEAGLLPARVVAPLRDWLAQLATEPGAGAAVVAATRDGAVDDVLRQVEDLALAADAQAEAVERLRSSLDAAYAQAREQVRRSTSDGSMLRGEVLARWQDFVGTGEFFRALERRVGAARDRVVGFLRGRPTSAPQVQEAIAHGLEAVLLDASESAAERTWSTWRADPAGRALVDDPTLARAPSDLRTSVAAEIRAWQSDVLDLVREQGAGRRGVARAVSFGLNGIGVSLMVVVFASTGGLTGIEVGVAGGTAVAAQKVLEAVFGDDAVRRLARQAHERLDDRVQALLDGQRRRYEALLDAALAGVAGGGAVRAAARDLDAAARAERATRPADARRGLPAAPSDAVPPDMSPDALSPDAASRDRGPRDRFSTGEQGPGSTAPRTGLWARLRGRRPGRTA